MIAIWRFWEKEPSRQLRSLLAQSGSGPAGYGTVRLWYRTQRPPIEPNIKLLQEALDQTHRSAKYDAHEWQSLVRNRLASINIKDITGDVHPFLEHPQDASLLTRENLSGLFSSQ